jgi:hypothetical protein
MMMSAMVCLHRTYLEQQFANRLQSAFREYNRENSKRCQGHELRMTRPLVYQMDSIRHGALHEITSRSRSKTFKMQCSDRICKYQRIDFDFDFVSDIDCDIDCDIDFDF